MHFLNYLRKPTQEQKAPSEIPIMADVLVEYRLICSGTLFPAHFQGDPSKSDRARILLQGPFDLLIASQPHDSDPQELALRFPVSMVSAHEGDSAHSYYPDPEIAADLAALLTLLCRRLITVSVRVRQQFLTTGPPGPFPPPPPVLLDYPCPVVTTAKDTHWKPRPIESMYGLDGVEVRNYAPAPQPFDTCWVAKVLSLVPDLPAGSAIIRAARRYALAMQLIERHQEISYQLLISAVETMAGEVDLKWKPQDKDKLQLPSSKALITHAKTKGICQEVAMDLALHACENYSWSSRRFREFVLENVIEEDLEGEDDLFWVPQEFCPGQGQLRKALRTVYDARSGATHGGRAYPVSASIGPPSHRIPVKAMDEILNKKLAFPPVAWFERVTNYAICGYLRSQLE